MRPPACVSCKWGTGTTCERESNTAASKELEARLKQMQQERNNQDIAWFAPPKETTQKQDPKKKSTK